MTPLGHAAAAYLLARGVGLKPLPAVAAGTAMDLDFLMVWHEGFNVWHRTVTHNLAAALLLGGLAVLAARARPWPVFAAAFAAACLHLACDAMLDTNPTNGIGVALFWPFSDAMWSPLNLASGADVAAPHGWADFGASLSAGLWSSLYELPLIAVASFFFWRSRR